VHACLVDSALLFEAATVGRLDDAGRQRFHEEQMLAAEMVRIPRSTIPPTVPELRAYLQAVYDSGILRVGEAATRVAELFHDPPREAEWRPVLTGVSRLAFGTLPPELRSLYGVDLTPARRAAMRAAFAATRWLRPLLPDRYRFIAPYQEWLLRRAGKPVPERVTRGRRSLGLAIDEAESLPG
ncbi:MAG TPA: oxygenase MpaB family protein, partial [Actinomycetota bacterium]|nr:oxygenase MpaB family protein [Actinomycetota bacterium]